MGGSSSREKQPEVEKKKPGSNSAPQCAVGLTQPVSINQCSIGISGFKTLSEIEYWHGTEMNNIPFVCKSNDGYYHPVQIDFTQEILEKGSKEMKNNMNNNMCNPFHEDFSKKECSFVSTYIKVNGDVCPANTMAITMNDITNIAPIGIESMGSASTDNVKVKDASNGDGNNNEVVATEVIEKKSTAVETVADVEVVSTEAEMIKDKNDKNAEAKAEASQAAQMEILNKMTFCVPLKPSA